MAPAFLFSQAADTFNRPIFDIAGAGGVVPFAVLDAAGIVAKYAWTVFVANFNVGIDDVLIIAECPGVGGLAGKRQTLVFVGFFFDIGIAVRER